MDPNKPLSAGNIIPQCQKCNRDAVVLDPFVGSGTTAVAAKRLGKNYIGVDSNKEYVKISERRLKEVEGKEDAWLFKRQNKERESFQLEFQGV